jgi:hypothetical protein
MEENVGKKETGCPDLVISNNSVVQNEKISVDNNANATKLFSTYISKKNLDTFDDGEDDYSCGFGPFRPEWIQRFATKKAFMVVFTLLGVIQGMTWSYFTATISTLEKRFKISSQTAGKLYEE